MRSVLAEMGVKPAQRAPKPQGAAEPGLRWAETTQLLRPEGSYAVPKQEMGILLS